MGLFTRSKKAKVKRVDVATAQQMIANGAILLDVRETDEWQAGHSPQAMHAPLSSFQDQIKRLPTNKNYVVICRSGNRSQRARDILVKKGFVAVDLVGGLKAWAQADLPVETTSGRLGHIA